MFFGCTEHNGCIDLCIDQLLFVLCSAMVTWVTSVSGSTFGTLLIFNTGF